MNLLPQCTCSACWPGFCVHVAWPGCLGYLAKLSEGLSSGVGRLVVVVKDQRVTFQGCVSRVLLAFLSTRSVA